MGVDLHLHSTASDGTVPPEEVPDAARSVGLHTIALTDHDTVDGVGRASERGAEIGVRVIAGCEFSVEAWWGELHLLGYFLPLDNVDLELFLAKQREQREGRVAEILSRLAALGVSLSMQAVVKHAEGRSLGRPHIARALVHAGAVDSVQDAFDRYLADGKRAFVPRILVKVDGVVTLVRALGGVTSAAHLKHRGTRSNISRLRDVGVDAIEVRHPAHSQQVSARLRRDASDLGMLMTGGSDWHGGENHHGDPIGAIDVPEAWLTAMERLHHERVEGEPPPAE